jgi:tRNA threonylcarbamoyladenosine biosynthesis protein TsaB
MAAAQMTNYTLVIDTSAGTTVAVFEDDQLLADVNHDESMKHAEQIGVAITQVLAEAKITPSQITQVVVGRGPAPFTGLRIGLAAAKMFATGVSAKLFGVCSLDAIAWAEFSETAKSNQPVLVTADARRSEHYWALYSGLSESGTPILVDGPGVMKPAALEERFAAQDYFVTNKKISAADLGKVFIAQQKDGTASSVVDALYLRDPDAVAPKVLRDFGKKVSG